jgi:hypothetical protein
MKKKKNIINVIQRIRVIEVTGNKNALPRGEISENIELFTGNFLFKGTNFAGDISFCIL